ncbi:sigma 54 modulation protein/ribosomal protein S30EA, partial [mine drainage metagenome]
MEIVVRSRDIEVTAALRAHVARKVRKLDRLLEGKGDGPAEVRLAVERGRHIAEVTMPLNGFLLRGEERGDDMYASVDHVIQKLERQLKKLRARGHRPRQQNASS